MFTSEEDLSSLCYSQLNHMLQRSRTACLLVAVCSVMSTTVFAQVVPQDGGVLVPHVITVNNQPDDQTDPHVDGDLVVYSTTTTGVSIVQEIKYYRFSTGIDSTVPKGPLDNDLLSDVDQGRIVFTRIFPSRTVIMLFDTATGVLQELAPAPDPALRFGEAIGGQTVAFVDYSLASDGTGELVVLDLATSLVTRLTDDTVDDANPAVSPDGNVVVWERCPVSVANCDIYSASRSGDVWTIHAVATSPLNEANPDTNGVDVVFERDNSTGPTLSNIVVAPVSGGSETELEIPGDQFNPSIRGSIIAFQSQANGGAADIYLYDRASNTRFQITNTPTTDETLNDVTLLPTGEVRLVWRAGGLSNGDIFAATFALPSVVQCVRVIEIGTHDTGQCRGFIGIPTGIGTVDMVITSPSVGSSFAGRPIVGDNWPNVPGVNFPVGTISFTALLPAGMEGGDMTMLLTFRPPLAAGLTQLFKVVDTSGNPQPIDAARWSRTDTGTATIITLTLTDGLFPLDLDAHGESGDCRSPGDWRDGQPAACCERRRGSERLPGPDRDAERRGLVGCGWRFVELSLDARCRARRQCGRALRGTDRDADADA